MRPALLRLLKRPAAISLLNDLFLTTSAPAIERLSASSGLCERCQIRQAHARLHPNPLPASLPVADSTAKLQVYDVDCDIRPTRARQQRTSRRSVEENLPLPLNADQLEFESSLLTRTTNGKRRLVDGPANQNDFALWKELLRYRKRRYAQHGVLEIWRGLCARKNDIKLPVEGDLADYLWDAFLEAGLADEQLLFDVAKYAEELWNTSGKRWDKFYQKVVGGLFSQGLPEQAVAWHRRLQSIHLGDPNNIQLVMDQALSCVPRTFPDWTLYSTETIALGNGRGLRAFGEICLATKDHRIYERLIPFLLRKGLYLDATYMHDFLVKRGDIPHGSTTVQQLIDFTTSESHTFSQRVRQRIKKIKSDTLNPSFLESLVPVKQDAQLNSSSQEKDSEPKPSQNYGQDWIQEKTFKDEFGARLFATKALTVDTITNGLQMFGVQAIGPLSLREIALRAGGAKEILEKMRALREANITIQDCAFTRLVERLALEHKDIVLEDLLHSDQHPDVMEDVAVQESLLCSYLLARDWRLYNLTKAILNEVAKDDMDNIQFRVSLSSKEWSAASDIADRVFLDGGTLTQQSINHMFYAVLTPRLPGRHEPYVEDPQFDEVSYAMRILKAAHRSGTDIDPRYWIELLKRMGMHRHDHWQQIHDLCSWLALNYALREESPFLHSLSRSLKVDSRKILAQNRTAIRHIFNPRMQMALVAWGFKSNLWYKNQICEISDPVGGGKVISWTRGLILLRELETLGVTIFPSFVRKACRERLRMLFGELYSVRRWNRTLREKNTIDLSRIVMDMTTIYPTLFTQEERANSHKIIDRPLPSMATKRMREHYEWLDQWPASRLR